MKGGILCWLDRRWLQFSRCGETDLKIGILADIHEAHQQLRRAIDCLRSEKVQEFVVLGDIFETGRGLENTVELLAQIGVVGVFGNHDLGLSVAPDEQTYRRYGTQIVDFFAGLRPRYEIDDCLFTHSQAWMDPADIEQPWYLHPIPATDKLLAQNFAATDQRVMFQGHYHRWLAAVPAGPLSWQGGSSLKLDMNQRYLIVVHAVCDGWSAVYDTERAFLQPLRI